MIISKLYLAWSLLLLFQTWLEAHVPESCCSSLPWQIVWWSFLTNLPPPYPRSWGSPWGRWTQHHSPLCGVGTAVTLLLCSRNPCGSSAAQENTALFPFSAYSWAQANVSCHVCALSLPKCISHAVHVALLLRQRACPVEVCLCVLPYPCPYT